MFTTPIRKGNFVGTKYILNLPKKNHDRYLQKLF